MKNDEKVKQNAAQSRNPFFDSQYPPKQRDFHNDPAQNRWMFGGNRTGKTHCGAQEAVWWATATHPYRDDIKNATEGWIVSLSTRVQRDVAQKKVLALLREYEKQWERDYIAACDTGKKKEKNTEKEITAFECTMLSGKRDSPERGVIDFITVRNKYGTDSKIGFRNCEQGREKFQGTSLDWVWFDEEPGEDIYEECLMRTLDKGGYIWGTMTPLKGKTWVYDRIYMAAAPDISVRTLTWFDNPYLCEKEIKKMERNYSTEALLSRRDGQFTEGIGLVFKEFSEANIVSDLVVASWREKAVYHGITIDPGYTNPTAVLWCVVDGDGNICVIADYKTSGMNVEELAKEIHHRSKMLNFEAKDVFIDSAAAASSLAEPRSVAEQFRHYGLDVNTGVEKNIREGIHHLKTLFKNGAGKSRLFISEACVNLIKELRGYYWGDNEKPVKSNDHCIDALRYFVMSPVLSNKKQKTVMCSSNSKNGMIAFNNKQMMINKIDKFKRRLQRESS